MDYQSCQQFQYDEFKNMILQFGKDLEPKIFNYLKINPQGDSRVFSKKMEKKYIPVCQKGIINKNYEVLPFGYQ